MVVSASTSTPLPVEPKSPVIACL